MRIALLQFNPRTIHENNDSDVIIESTCLPQNGLPSSFKLKFSLPPLDPSALFSRISRTHQASAEVRLTCPPSIISGKSFIPVAAAVVACLPPGISKGGLR